MSDDAEWRHVAVSFEAPVVRSGFRGAWDAFHAAMMRRPTFAVLTPITVSAWIKSKEKPEMQVTGAQIISNSITRST